MVYKCLNYTLGKLSTINTSPKKPEVFLNSPPKRRLRTISESKSVSQLNSIVPAELLLTAERISCTVYDCSESGKTHLVEPFLLAELEQPSFSLKLIKSSGCNLRTKCYDMALKSFDSLEKILTDSKPFLPSKENFNIVWIETREGKKGPNGAPPALYTLTISDFLLWIFQHTKNFGSLKIIIQKFKRL